MPPLDRPKLRPLSGRRLDHDGRSFVALEDPLGLFAQPMLVPWDAWIRVVQHFDGTRTLAAIQALALRETGHFIDLADLESLTEQLDQALVLDGPTFQAFRRDYAESRVRPPAFAGRSYASTQRSLQAQLLQCFAGEGGAGEPTVGDVDGRLRGILSPHIDFRRGGRAYSWAYRALAERSDADTFVILGVAHQACARRFVLTRKDFDTPLGLVETDRDYVDRIAEFAGPTYFDDELAHRMEHSVEFQAVFLKYVLGDRPFRIVPILVGSFYDLMIRRAEPIEDAEVRQFIEALKQAEREAPGKVVYIAGIDLCHVGPEFGDPDPVSAELLGTIRSFDEGMLGHATGCDAAGWFGHATKVQDRWRVCGLAATYTMLQAMGPAEGLVLNYQQAVDEGRTCCVSFASVSYQTTEAP
ncbi:AmmeMemoRadiSam system protein B [Isosphaeraceae bacterium EP7]